MNNKGLDLNFVILVFTYMENGETVPIGLTRITQLLRDS